MLILKVHCVIVDIDQEMYLESLLRDWEIINDIDKVVLFMPDGKMSINPENV